MASKAGPSGWFESLPWLQGALCIVYKLRAQSLKNNGTLQGNSLRKHVKCLYVNKQVEKIHTHLLRT